MSDEKNMPSAYEPKTVEDNIYKKWEDSGFFNPDNLTESTEPFTISMPPPNATGILHLGHASMLAYQDLMIRYARMQGKKALWVPGTDHAGIATQAKVEQLIAKDKLKKEDLGREEFIKKVEEFVADKQNTIKSQIRKMGSSCDWSRERYTLDAGLSEAVSEIFIRMYNDKLIYQGHRIVNWCPCCQSTLSDDEVEHKEQKAKLYTFKYSKDLPFAIATTRPETKLGDTAVAINSNDARYQKLIGQTLEVEFLGQKLKLKVITDNSIDQNFGSGVLGVTPAHSLVDFEMAQKNNLPVIQIIDQNNKMTAQAGRYQGLTSEECRQKVVEDLAKEGLMEKVEEINNNLSVCYRCDTAVEPLISKQWFIDVNKKITIANNSLFQDKSIKEVAIQVVKDGQIKIVPNRFTKTYFHWIENLRDWCISRQIWWGHRLPVWHRIEGTAKKTKICFMRHGQTDWNMQKIMQGQTETELNETGKQQAKEKIEFVKNMNPDIIISSPMKRALDTIKIATENQWEIITDDRLKERGYGKLEGLKTDDIKKQYPQLKFFNRNDSTYFIDCPDGESYDEVYARSEKFLIDIINKYSGKKILIVSHEDTLDMLEAVLQRKTWQEIIGSWSNNARTLSVNICHHVDQLLRPVDKENIQAEMIVSKDCPSAVSKDEHGHLNICEGWRPDGDTLDTWFSSGLWTFSTLGWPKQTEDLKKFHPTTVMETGYDILFFWIARMIIMSTYALGDIPFKNVYLHGLIRDEQGRKMSKSLGNGIDPIDMCEKYGTDALRMSMIIGCAPGNDMNLGETKIAGYRNFTNKLWNISRYILSTNQSNQENKDWKLEIGNWKLSDKWILAKLNNLTKEVTEHLDKYEFSPAGEKIRMFVWDDLADWYLEISKVEKGKDEILKNILINILKLLHPFMPFVTEEIWSKINPEQLLMIAKWPIPELGITNDESRTVEENFEMIRQIITGIRNARNENKIEPAKKINAIIFAGQQTNLIQEQAEIIKFLARVENLEIKDQGAKPEQAIALVVGKVEIYLPLAGMINIEQERKRISSEIEQIKKLISNIEVKLNNQEFVTNAPANIVEKEKARITEQKEKLGKLEKNLGELK